MRNSLRHDKRPYTIQTDIAGLTAFLVCVLDTAATSDLPPKDVNELMDLARILADMLEKERPEVEPYIAMLFGVAGLRRAMG